MALEDIVMIADDIVEPISEIPQGTLNIPQDEVSDHMINELTLVLEASFSS